MTMMIGITKLCAARAGRAAAAGAACIACSSRTAAHAATATVAAAAAAHRTASLIVTVLIMLMIVIVMMMMRRLILILSGNDAAHILQTAATATGAIQQLWSNAQKRGRAIYGIHNGLQQAAALEFMRGDFAASGRERLISLQLQRERCEPTYRTGVVAPEPPRELHGCPLGCVGLLLLMTSLPAVVACDTSQASTV